MIKLIFREPIFLATKKLQVIVILSTFAAMSANAQSNVTDYSVLNLTSGQKIDFVIEGQPVSAYASPGMPSELTISNAFAQSIFGKGANKFASTFERILDALAKDDFDTSPPRYIQSAVGKIKIRGQQRPAKVRFGNQSDNQYVQWYQTDIHKFGEALAGPFAIPAPVIRFALRPEQRGETQFSMPLVTDPKRRVASTQTFIGKKKVYFAFAPQFETTLASAAAGAVIAQNYGGEFVGDPVPVVVAFNVARPARPVQLKSPLPLGVLTISKFQIRSRDYGDTSAIKEAKSPNAAEENEILVQAKRKGTDPEYFVYVGNDMLKNCSSITYDKPARTVTLSCLPSK
jgi:hypothetical protein